MLLSSVAEAMYWCGRYLERAQALSRVVSSYERLSLDLPGARPLELQALLPLIGKEAVHGAAADHAQLLGALVFDATNSSSVLGALGGARENLRHARVDAPTELWVSLNQLYNRIASARGRTGAAVLEVLDETLAAGSRFEGERAAGMTRDAAYAFLTIGCQLERADMLLRSLAALLPPLSPNGWERVFDDVRWSGLLHALGVHSAYRRRHHHHAELTELFALLLVSRDCPRSVAYCLLGIEQQLQGLPRAHQPRAALAAAEREGAALSHAKNGDVTPDLERALESFAELHGALVRAYFPVHAEPSPSISKAPAARAEPGDPFEYLGQEHVRLDALLRVLDELSLRAQGDQPVDRSDLNAVVAFLNDFGELDHHEKEESILTPALVAHGFDWYSGPLAVMRREHRQEHYFVRVLTHLARQRDAWSIEDARRFVSVASEFCRFLRAHMDHERRDLFEQAARALPEQAKQRLVAAFRAFDAQQDPRYALASSALDQLLGKYGVVSPPGKPEVLSGAV